MIETNRLYDTYFLLHQPLTNVDLGKTETVFKQGLVTDKGAIYLKTTSYVYDMSDILTKGTPTQFEYLANVFDVFHPLDRTKPWSVCYTESIIKGLFFKSLVGLGRFFQMFYEASVVPDDEGLFQLEHWIDTYNDNLLIDFDPQELAAAFKFHKLRDPYDYEYKMSQNQPQLYMRFTKNAYKTLSPNWLQDHIVSKYGSLEEAHATCRVAYPELFDFAEQLKVQHKAQPKV